MTALSLTKILSVGSAVGKTNWTDGVLLFPCDHVMKSGVQEEKERKEQEDARKKQDEDAKKKKVLTNRTQQYGGIQQRVGNHTEIIMQMRLISVYLLLLHPVLFFFFSKMVRRE